MKVYLVMDAYDRECNGVYSTRELAETRIDELNAREFLEIEEYYLHTEESIQKDSEKVLTASR